MRRFAYLTCLLLFTTWALSGCGTLLPTATPTPTPASTLTPTPAPRPGPKAGSWAGSSSVSFSVTETGEIGDFTIVVSLFGKECTVTVARIVPDADGAFVVTGEFNGRESRVTTLSGRFESDTTMSGTADVQFCYMPDGSVLVLDVFPPPVEWTAEWKSAMP